MNASCKKIILNNEHLLTSADQLLNYLNKNHILEDE